MVKKRIPKIIGIDILPAILERKFPLKTPPRAQTKEPIKLIIKYLKVLIFLAPANKEGRDLTKGVILPIIDMKIICLSKNSHLFLCFSFCTIFLTKFKCLNFLPIKKPVISPINPPVVIMAVA